MKLRVLIVSPLPPPAGGMATWSAAVIQATQLIDNVDVINLDTAVRWRSTNDVSFYRRLVFGATQAIADVIRTYHHIKTFKPHVIHLCTSASLSTPKDVLIMALAKIFGVRCIIHYHFGRLPTIISDNTVEWKLIRVAMMMADAVILLDSPSRDSIRVACPELTTVIIPNPIPMPMVDRVVNSSRKWLKNKTNIHIVYAGHVMPTKGIRELINACLLIYDYQFDLALVGTVEDDFRAELEELAKIRDAGKWLNFYGMMGRQETMEIIRDSDIFVLPSYTEGFPNVLLEAMALGKPIVATKVGAIPEMLGGNLEEPCGILIEPKHVYEMRDALIELLMHQDRASEYGKRAREKIVKHYEMDAVMKQYLDIWKRFVKFYT